MTRASFTLEWIAENVVSAGGRGPRGRLKSESCNDLVTSWLSMKKRRERSLRAAWQMVDGEQLI